MPIFDINETEVKIAKPSGRAVFKEWVCGR